MMESILPFKNMIMRNQQSSDSNFGFGGGGSGTFLDKISPNPDLYGPFWISTTVIFALFVTSSIAGSIYAYLDNKPYSYDMTLLSFAVSTVYFYATVMPGVVWGLGRYFGVPNLRFFELVDLYGYGLAIWIPVSVSVWKAILGEGVGILF
jgi:hypothetical protein